MSDNFTQNYSVKIWRILLYSLLFVKIGGNWTINKYIYFTTEIASVNEDHIMLKMQEAVQHKLSWVSKFSKLFKVLSSNHVFLIHFINSCHKVVFFPKWSCQYRVKFTNTTKMMDVLNTDHCLILKVLILLWLWFNKSHEILLKVSVVRKGKRLRRSLETL